MLGPTGLQPRDLQMFTQGPAPTHLCSQQLKPRPNHSGGRRGEERALCKAHSGNTWEENVLQKGEREGRDRVGERKRGKEGERMEEPKVGSGP